MHVLAKQNIMLLYYQLCEDSLSYSVRRGRSGTLYSDNGKEVRRKGSNNKYVILFESDLIYGISKIESMRLTQH